MIDDLILFRRTLHQIPELSNQEYETQKYLIETLLSLGYRPKTLLKTGVIAHLDLGKEKTIAFRADCDGLPIHEETRFGAMLHQGRMHACGHDGHMAILLTLAKILAGRKKELDNNILFIFQPAEEKGAGAKRIVKSGILKQFPLAAIYGLHLNPNIEKGLIMFRQGVLMAGSTEFDLTVTGPGGHISQEDSRDILSEGWQILSDFQKIIHQKYYQQAILGVGIFRGGNARNIRPSKVVIKGSIRFFSPFVETLLLKEIKQILSAYKNVSIRYRRDYPPVENDIELANNFKDCLIAKNMKYMELEEPVMMAEDFSHYHLAAPSFYFFVGTNDLNFSAPLHSKSFDFDEASLQVGVEAYLAILGLKYE